MTQTREQEEAFVALQTMLKSMAEQQEREYVERKAAERSRFFRAIPEQVTSLYIHLSHRISNHLFVENIRKDYGSDNILVTIAPATSGQSFYDNSRDKIAEAEKRKQVIEPFESFSSRKSIDAIIYL